MFHDVMRMADRRFLLNAFLPSAAFLLALTGLVAQRTAPASTDLWRRIAAAHLTAAALVAALVVAFVVAAFVSTQTGVIIRWYEGDWRGPVGRFAAATGRRFHLRRLSRLDPRNGADYDRIYHDYPLPGRVHDVQPTRIGNILRNAETYPADRYGMDTAIVWPRLHPLLPEPVAAAIAAAKADMEFQLVVATLAATFSGVGTVILAVTDAPSSATLACLWGSGLLADISYRGALGAARRYGGQVKVAVDLYRLTLLQQLGIPNDEMRSSAQQRAAYTSLAQWWYRNVPLAAQAEPATDDIDENGEPQQPSTASGRRPLAPSLHAVAATGAVTASVVILLLAR
ncbi:hypothetical protein [Streptomyces sp. NPDC005209]|uniref:hypothetical protein n=1 Tax=Streptomyces sp. NPDC005209 TaxID=3156715 RepID=UPI0033A16A72